MGVKLGPLHWGWALRNVSNWQPELQSGKKILTELKKQGAEDDSQA
jgi:hypothetical protein